MFYTASFSSAALYQAEAAGYRNFWGPFNNDCDVFVTGD